jgi:hypothetical protein
LRFKDLSIPVLFVESHAATFQAKSNRSNVRP